MDSLEGTEQLNVRVRLGIIEKLRRFAVQEWGNRRNILGIIVEKAIEEYIENHSNVAHTHINSNKNNTGFNPILKHKRGRKPKVIVDNEPVATPTPTSNSPLPIVLSNNGKSSNEEQPEDVFQWAERLGVKVEARHIEMANRIRNDSEFKSEKKNEWIVRLQSKEKRQISESMENMKTSGSTENKELLKRLVAFANSPGRNNEIYGKEENVYDTGHVSDENLRTWIRLEYDITDKRSIQARVDKLEGDGETVKVVKTSLHGKPKGWEKDALLGWRIENIGSLYS
jgi:hypothetical protein